MASELPDEGEPIFVIGNPLKLEGSVSDGIVSAVREVPNSYRIIQITAPISHGNSGSPVFNLKGQVLGVVTIKVTNGQNINLAIAAARVAELKAGKLQPLSELALKGKGDVAESLYRIRAWIRSGSAITTMRLVISKTLRTKIRGELKRGCRLDIAE